MSITEQQLHEAIELGDEFLVGSSGEKIDYCKRIEDELRGEIGGVKRKAAPGPKQTRYRPGITPLRNQLSACGDAYDELWQNYVDATGTVPPRYDDPRVIDVGAKPRVFIRYPNGGYRLVSATEAVKYNSLPLAAKKLYQARHDPSCANISGKPASYYRMVQTPGGTTLRMAAHLADQWKALSPAQQRSLLWRATRNRGTRQARQLPCL